MRKVSPKILIIFGVGLILYGLNGLITIKVNHLIDTRITEFHVIHPQGDPHLVWRKQSGKEVVWYVDLPLQNDYINLVKTQSNYKMSVILPDKKCKK